MGKMHAAQALVRGQGEVPPARPSCKSPAPSPVPELPPHNTTAAVVRWHSYLPFPMPCITPPKIQPELLSSWVSCQGPHYWRMRPHCNTATAVVAYACIPSTWEAEVRGLLEFQENLHSKYQASQAHIARLCLKKLNK